MGKLSGIASFAFQHKVRQAVRALFRNVQHLNEYQGEAYSWLNLKNRLGFTHLNDVIDLVIPRQDDDLLHFQS